MSKRKSAEDRFVWEEEDIRWENEATGITLIVGEIKCTLGTSSHVNQFLNEIATMDEYPHLIGRSWEKGVLSLDYMGKPQLAKSSLVATLEEVKRLEENHIEELSYITKYIASKIREACSFAIKYKKDVEIRH